MIFFLLEPLTLRLESADPVPGSLLERVECCIVALPSLIDSGQDIDSAEAVCQSDFETTFWLQSPACFIDPHALRLRNSGYFVKLNQTIVPRLRLSQIHGPQALPESRAKIF